MPAGFRVGRQLAERYTANRARTGEPLEVIKFICKEFWVAVFRKQVDVPLHYVASCVEPNLSQNGVIQVMHGITLLLHVNPRMPGPPGLQGSCSARIGSRVMNAPSTRLDQSMLYMQVDNLRTNHRGTFVLKDLSFRWLAKLSVDPVPPGTALQNGAPPVHPAAGDFSQLQCTALVCAATRKCATRRHAVATINPLLHCAKRAKSLCFDATGVTLA